MNTLNELKTTIAQATGAKSVKFSPNGRVADLILRDGSKESCLVNFRNIDAFEAQIYSFSDDYLQDLRAINDEEEKGLIIVADDSDLSRIFVINPYCPSPCGVEYIESLDEWNSIWHHYLKTCG
ncbi:MAG: hypothetical protein J1E97_01200 [Muribaculaceae bacterium]|nr:hypothetical protein [Muribaculaceae bacterium]